MLKIFIYKQEKRMEVFDEKNTLLYSFPIAIGKEEKGPKEKEGDMKTPEGHYHICVKNPQSQYFLSLGLNYPNLQDAKKGLEKGLITQQEFKAIQKAHQENKIPPWKTALGGEIYIHGELEKQNWSHGCIRLFNSDMALLFSKAQINDEVWILNKKNSTSTLTYPKK